MEPLLDTMVDSAPTEVDDLSGWTNFGTIGFEKYLNFVLEGRDAGIDLELS